MQSKRVGAQTIDLPSKPRVTGHAAIVGPKEGQGPLGAQFDQVLADDLFGEKTWEFAESKMFEHCVRLTLQKGCMPPEQVHFLLGGDLLNQITAASFAARQLGLPYVGLYGACSTMSESLCVGGMLIDGGMADSAVCAASSHFCTAERQYRTPLELGNQRAPTAQWTVTGAGATLLRAPSQAPEAKVCVSRVTCGKVVDMGIPDANNMGAAMAPVNANIDPYPVGVAARSRRGSLYAIWLAKAGKTTTYGNLGIGLARKGRQLRRAVRKEERPTNYPLITIAQLLTQAV